MKKFLRPIIATAIITSLLSCEKENPEVANEEITTADAEAKAGSWQRVFTDNFNSSGNLNKWEKTSRKDYNSSICNYVSWNPRLASIDGKQCLELSANKYGSQYRAGHVKSKFSFKPQRDQEYQVVAYIKLVAKSGSTYKGFGQTYGAWPAFWTVQEHEWPKKGEIDIMEGYSKSPQSPHFASNLFYGTSTGNNQLGSSCERSYNISEGWHKYEQRWKNDNGNVTVEIYVDGSRKARYTNATNSRLRLQNFGPHNIILNMNVGSDSGIFDNSKINLYSRTYMYVDYVRVSKRSI